MSERRRRRKLDFTSVSGVPVGIGLVLLGQTLEGGSLSSILQITAALIVFGGTLGAVLVSFSLDDVRQALAGLKTVFFEVEGASEATIERVVQYAVRARRKGIMDLENVLETEPDDFMRKGLRLAVDGSNPRTLRDMLELESAVREEREEVPSRVFEAAGGYAPTVGILGAVLGLIQVMENLSDPAKLGAGIAVAFVATVYGVGSANLIFLPIASKLRLRTRDRAKLRELALEGVMAIQEGLNPRLIEEKLRTFADRPAPRAEMWPGRAA